jgi:hypothetical protein
MSIFPEIEWFWYLAVKISDPYFRRDKGKQRMQTTFLVVKN